MHERARGVCASGGFHSQVAGKETGAENGDYTAGEAVVAARKLGNISSSAAWAEARLG